MSFKFSTCGSAVCCGGAAAHRRSRQRPHSIAYKVSNVVRPPLAYHTSQNTPCGQSPSQPKRSVPKANFAPTQNLPLVRKRKIPIYLKRIGINKIGLFSIKYNRFWFKIYSFMVKYYKIKHCVDSI